MALGLCILLFVLMILVGGERGVAAVFTLIGNGIMLIICVYSISWGVNVYIATLVCAIIFAVFTLYFQNGRNKKTSVAMISVIAVMVLMTAICSLIVHRTAVGGFGELYTYQEEANFLFNEIHVNSHDLMTAVVILSLLGAIMDTALSISTAVYEVLENNKELTRAQLFASGNNIGRDILGTTVNTLIFAGIGEALFLWILFIRENYGIGDILNSDAFFQEFVVILIANIGCLLIIPLTSALSALLYKHKAFENRFGNGGSDE